MSGLQIKFLNLEPWDLPSSSSFSKLVLSMERVPPRSTTASSSVLWDTQEKRVTSENAASSGNNHHHDYYCSKKDPDMNGAPPCGNYSLRGPRPPDPIFCMAAPSQLCLAVTMATVCVCSSAECQISACFFFSCFFLPVTLLTRGAMPMDFMAGKYRRPHRPSSQSTPPPPLLTPRYKWL